MSIKLRKELDDEYCEGSRLLRLDPTGEMYYQYLIRKQAWRKIQEADNDRATRKEREASTPNDNHSG